jgi:type VI secretion system protein ImpH
MTEAQDMLRTLQAEPHRFSLFAALRLIERAYRDQPRLGESRRLANEPVRLAQPPHLNFAPSDVAKFDLREDIRDGKPTLEAYSFGVFGPNGALPLYLTETAYERRRQHNDPTINDFVNLFQHRMIALFYRAWADADPATNFDRPESDRFRLYMGSLMGLGADAGRGRSEVVDFAMLGRAAQFGSQARSATGLEAVLADYFDVPLKVGSFVGAWMDIPNDACMMLGRASTASQLGSGATLGSGTWQCQHKFEIAIGPLRLHDFTEFLPGSKRLTHLAELLRLYTNDEWSWQMRLLLKGDEVPRMQLGGGARLGWTTWMGGRDAVATDVVIQGDLCQSDLN